MRIAGILEPGTTLGYITLSKYIKGTLIVCQTIKEIDELLNSGALVNGSPVYVADTDSTYKYNSDKKLFTRDPTFVVDNEGKLLIKNEDGTEEPIHFSITLNDLAPELKEQIENAPTTSDVETIINESLKSYATIESITTLENTLLEKLNTKQDKLVAGKNITIEGNIISATIEGSSESQVRFSTRNEFPSSGEINTLYIATDENKIYTWNNLTTNYELTNQIDITIIDGGKAVLNIRN